MADRIPDEVRKHLRPAELLARCEYAAKLNRTALDVTDGPTARGYFAVADQILRAMAPRQLEADLAVLNKGLATAPSGLAGGYSAAMAQLETDNPQVPAEYLSRAEAAVTAANGPTSKHFTNPSSIAQGDGRTIEIAPGRWIRTEDGEPLLTKALPPRTGR